MGARQLSPFLGERMTPTSFEGKAVVVRELRPQDLKFEFEGLNQKEAVLTARLLAGVVGWPAQDSASRRGFLLSPWRAIYPETRVTTPILRLLK
jgi:Uncharacterized protein conserved in bacteria (DUF2252)